MATYEMSMNCSTFKTLTL